MMRSLVVGVLRLFPALPYKTSKLSASTIVLRAWLMLLLLAGLAAQVSIAQTVNFYGSGGTAPHNLGSVTVGSSSIPVGVVVSFVSDVNSASFSVLTQGATGLDFTDAGNDTCMQNQSYAAGSSCTINVQFSPKAAGLRSGALVVKDSTGTVVGTNLLCGTGVAPIAAFDGASPTTFISGISQPANMMIDASGNLFVASNTGSGNVYEFSSAGIRLKVFPGIYGPVAAFEDPVGNVFTYSSGGCCWNSLVEYTPTGGTSTFLISTTLGQIIGSLVQDPSGNFYLPDTHVSQAGLIKLTLTGSGYSESHLLPSQTVYAVPSMVPGTCLLRQLPTQFGRLLPMEPRRRSSPPG